MNWSKISLLIGLLPFFSSAQAPQKISYQAVIRNANNSLVVSKAIGLRISILNGAIKPVTVYEETQQTFTNAFGLVSIQIGAGKTSLGEMSTISWAKGQYFIKTDIDPEGGSNYQLSGLTELTSVPFALFALNSGVSQEIATGGTVPGPQGERGLTGENGATGLMGLTGETGLTGATGPAGASGSNGIDGLAGLNGIDGAAGATGATGPQGTIGLTGNTGATGTNGIDGAAGATGATGPQGLTGLTGNTGATGTNGIDGAKGAVGLTGLPGTNGSNGIQGIPGSNGSNGAQGPIGLTGARGLTGNAGNNGATGTQGVQGPQGNPGLDGHDQVKFNKSLAPVTFEGDPKVTADQIFNSGIFVSLKGDTSFTFPELGALIEMLGEKATDGDVITIVIGSNTGITTLIPGAGGSIVGPDTVMAGQTRVVYIRFEIKAGSYYIY